MTINKFQGKTKEEAIEKAKQEFGSNAVIMNVREIKPKGMLRAFMSSTYEVTAAMEERDVYATPRPQIMQTAARKLHDNINVAADEEIAIPRPPRARENVPAQEPQVKKPVFEVISEKALAKPAPEKEPSPQQNIRGVQPFSPNVGASPRNVGLSPAARPMPQAETETKERVVDIKRYVPEKFTREDHMEKRLEELSNRLEETLGPISREEPQESRGSEELNFVRILYGTLLKNEVRENYVNQIIEEIEKFIRPGNSVDMILANVYQKLILRFGRPHTIELTGAKPKVIFFMGPTGVGKTTTIAKIASKYKMEYDRKVAFITSDTYRIAATEQLKVYANILDAPMSVVYNSQELNEALSGMADCDLVFVDTTGFSHKNESQKEATKELLSGIEAAYPKEVYLVLSATTKYQDLQDIVDIYRQIGDYKLLFTKLDETTCYGNILNIKLYSGAELSYVTNGQNVPEDIEVFQPQKIVKQLLGGK